VANRQDEDMKLKLFGWVAALGVGLALTAQGATNDITSALQKGLFEEEANHNLPAAIQAYESVVAQFDQDRRLAATAVFRLGECYRKQGKTNEAVFQYERVLREFSDHPELTTLSSQSLRGLRISGQEAVARVEGPEGGKGSKLFAETEDAETVEVNRIRALIKDSPDLINARKGIGEAETLLHKAASMGQARVVQFLLEGGAEVGVRNKSGSTPLHLAARLGRREIVLLLLGGKADPNSDSQGQTPAHLAAGEGYKAVVETLLDAGGNPNAKDSAGKTPLHWAAEKDRKAVVELLLAKGARVNEPDGSGQTALHVAAGLGNVNLLSILLDAGADLEAKTNSGMTPLAVAVNGGNLTTVRTLLARKANPNVEYEVSFTGIPKGTNWPIIGAAVRDLPLLESLLTNGANPNVKGVRPFGSDDQNGYTPLFFAVAYSDDFSKNLAKVQMLLKFKADPNLASESGKTPLHLALGQPQILQCLLDAKAIVNAATKTGETPLHWAVGAGLKTSVAMLLTNGADVNARDSDGFTPLHWASISGNQDIAELLLSSKADPNVRDAKDRTPLELARVRIYKTSFYEAPGVVFPRLQEVGSTRSLRLPPYTGPIPPAQPTPQVSEDRTAVAEALKRHGALENVPRPDRIQVSRASANYSAQVFKRDTNDWNHFTLLELIAAHYLFLNTDPAGQGSPRLTSLETSWRNSSMEFPDFSRLSIRRLGASPGTWEDQTVNLAEALATGDCTKDVPLAWGDIVEIPVADHVLNSGWQGWEQVSLETLQKCLGRKVDIVVKGKVTTKNLGPWINTKPIIGASFWFKPVLLSSGLLLASSDLSRIKVTRTDPVKGEKREYILDCSESQPAPNFWLRDGDVIEVPDKE
jgi:cytohesin